MTIFKTPIINLKMTIFKFLNQKLNKLKHLNNIVCSLKNQYNLLVYNYFTQIFNDVLSH